MHRISNPYYRGPPRSGVRLRSTVFDRSIKVDQGRTLSDQCRTQSNTVEHGRTWSDQCRTRSNMVEHGRTRSNMVEHGRTRSNMVEHGRTWSNTVEHGRTLANIVITVNNLDYNRSPAISNIYIPCLGILQEVLSMCTFGGG